MGYILLTVSQIPFKSASMIYLSIIESLNISIKAPVMSQIASNKICREVSEVGEGRFPKNLRIFLLTHFSQLFKIILSFSIRSSEPFAG